MAALNQQLALEGSPQKAIGNVFEVCDIVILKW